MSAPDLRRRLTAEALGTGLLVATVIGSGIMASGLTQDVGLALLANTLATVAILFVGIAVLGPVSGAHFNPAVTLVMALRRAIPVRAAWAYGAAQIIGAAAGSVLVHAMFDQPLMQWATQARHGGGQWLAEGVATFGLVLTILGGLRLASPLAMGALVAGYIGAACWFTASTAFANPAVTLARMLSDSFAGIRPADAPAFVAAQILGAIVGMVLAGWLFARPRASDTHTGTGTAIATTAIAPRPPSPRGVAE